MKLSQVTSLTKVPFSKHKARYSSAFFSSTAESCVGLRQGVNSLATKMGVGNTQKLNGKLLHSLRLFHAVGDPLPGGGEDSTY